MWCNKPMDVVLDRSQAFCGRLMHSAVKKNSPEVVYHLIAQGMANSNTADKDGCTPLHVIAASQHKSQVLWRLLLDNGADVSAVNEDDRTPLHILAGNTHFAYSINMAKDLLRGGADVNSKDKWDETPLHLAAQSGNLKLVTLLLKNGADVRARNKQGWIPLIDAVRSRKFQVLEKLIICGSDVNSLDINERTPLDWVFKTHPTQERTVERLLEKGAIDYEAKHFLRVCMSTKNNQSPMVDVLIEYADLNELHEKGFSLRLGFKSCIEQTILKHVAKLDFLGEKINKAILDEIQANPRQLSYFKICQKELKLSKEQKLGDSTVTYYDLLAADNSKLIKYAGNESLIKCFQSEKWMETFEIYGKCMRKRMNVAINLKKSFDTATEFLKNFYPCELAVNKILSYLDDDDINVFSRARWNKRHPSLKQTKNF